MMSEGADADEDDNNDVVLDEDAELLLHEGDSDGDDDDDDDDAGACVSDEVQTPGYSENKSKSFTSSQTSATSAYTVSASA